MSPDEKGKGLYCADKHSKWVDAVHDIEHRINQVIHRSTGAIPHEIMFGKPADEPIKKIRLEKKNNIPTQEEVKKNLQQSAETRNRGYIQHFRPTDIEPADAVMVDMRTKSDAKKKVMNKLNRQMSKPYIQYTYSPMDPYYHWRLLLS